MAYKIRVSSKNQDLKSDELLEAVGWFGEAFRTHAKKAVAVAALLVLSAAAFGGYIWYGMEQESAAAQVEFEAAVLYHQRVSPPTEGETSSPTREDNLFQAINLYREVVSQYPGTRSAALSQYYLGNSYLELEEFDNAISAYQLFLKQHAESPVLVGLARQRLGYAFLSNGDLESAEKAFMESLDGEEALNKAHVLFEVGRLNEVQGKKEEAIQHYKKIILEHSTTVFIPEARVRLRGLGVKMEQAPESENSSKESTDESSAFSLDENPPEEATKVSPLVDIP